MFGEKTKPCSHPTEIQELKHSHELAIKSLQQDNALAIKEKEFELKHFKDDEVQALQKELSERKQEVAVLKKENEMLAKITNLNADIIDIKDLVANLINKLPEVKINSLSVHGSSDTK